MLSKHAIRDSQHLVIFKDENVQNDDVCLLMTYL